MTEPTANTTGTSKPEPAAVVALLGLGSNIGDKTANIARAIELLAAEPGIRFTAQSRVWRTPPWGVTDQDWFANACVAVSTTLSARELLVQCQAVENTMGRVRTLRWGPRVVDVDILTFGELQIDEPDLVIPHPRIAERAFVLAPLADIASDRLVGGRRVQDWLALADRTGLVPLD